MYMEFFQKSKTFDTLSELSIMINLITNKTWIYLSTWYRIISIKTAENWEVNDKSDEKLTSKSKMWRIELPTAVPFYVSSFNPEFLRNTFWNVSKDCWHKLKHQLQNLNQTDILVPKPRENRVINQFYYEVIEEFKLNLTPKTANAVYSCRTYKKWLLLQFYKALSTRICGLLIPRGRHGMMCLCKYIHHPIKIITHHTHKQDAYAPEQK